MGPEDFPSVNDYPKVATITPSCLNAKIFPFHPSPFESVIEMLKRVYPFNFGVGVGVEPDSILITSTQVDSLQSLDFKI
jgi:hypothetical protein